MSLRTFTVFQDAALSEAPQPKVARPNAMMTRSSTRNIASSSSATASGEAAIIDKENYHPVTGERAGPSGGENKKRKTILATKAQLAPVTKLKKEKDLHVEPQAKKRKPSTIATAKPKTKKDVKGTGSTKKSTAKRTGSKKVSPLPKVNEEEEGEKDRPTQADIDSRCYELTVKPLADVSEAYNELDVFQDLVTATTTAKNVVADDKVKYRTVKASSVEPEIRDYFQLPQAQSCSNVTSRFRSFSEGPSEARAFSTPERKQIYAAFTFSSPSGSSGQLSKASSSGSISPAESQ